MQIRGDIAGLVKALGHKDPYIRNGVIQAFVILGDPTAVPHICGSLTDFEASVQVSAATALGEFRDPKAVVPLLNACQGDSQAIVDVVKESLTKMGRTGVAQLCEALTSSSPAIRLVAAEVLGRIGDCRSVGPLCEALREQFDDIAGSVVGALVRIGEPALEALAEALKCEDAKTRLAAAEAVDRIGLPDDPSLRAWHAVAKQDWMGATASGPLAVEPLCMTLSDPSPGIREEAASALGRLGPVRVDGTGMGAALERLRAALKDEHPGVRAAAAFALGMLHDARSIEGLCACLGDDDSEVRKAAAGALSRGGLPDDRAILAMHAVASQDWERAASMGSIAIEPLIKVLRDNAQGIDSGALQALISIGSSAVIPLVAALDADDVNVRGHAAEALGRLGDPAVEALIAVFLNGTKVARAAAAMALGRTHDERALRPLCESLGYGTLGHRIWDREAREYEAVANSIRSLGELGDLRAVPSLLAITADGNSRAGWIMEAMIILDALSAKDPSGLHLALKGGPPSVRALAAMRLGDVGDRRSVSILEAALGDPEPAVGKRASEALSKIEARWPR